MTEPIAAASWISGGHYFEHEGRNIFHRRDGQKTGGATLVLLHGFPTWSYDYAEVATNLAADHDVITFDFLGYGASDKPRNHPFTVAESADIVEALLKSLHVQNARIVIHDYGGIVGQELLDRRRNDKLGFQITGVHLMNCGVVYEQYRPTRIQKLLANKWLGRFIASRITKAKVHAGLDGVRGAAHRLTDREFDELWYGISLNDGHKLAHRHIRYNLERALHATRWLSALTTYDGPLHLIWGTADPVSGMHVLDALRPLVPASRIDTLPGVGHFPMSEAPTLVADAIRNCL